MFLGTGAMAVKAPFKVSEAFGVNRGYNIPPLWQTLGLSLALLLCLCVNSLGGCFTYSERIAGGSYACGGEYTFVLQASCSNIGCQTVVCGDGGSINFTSEGGSTWHCALSGNKCSSRIDVTYCETQAEADSVQCEASGGTWENGECGGGGGSCNPETNPTLVSLNNACTAIGGASHYGLNDQCNVVGYCDLCGLDSSGNYSNPYVQAQYDEYAAGCCSSGMAPNPNNFSCNSDAGGCYGANCEWDPTSRVGIGASTLGFNMGLCNVNITTTIDGEIEGCEDYNENESSPESSSSGESSGESSSGGESSASTDEAILDGIEKVLDSLHKIIVIDSMNREYNQNSMFSLQGIYGILDTAHFGSRETTIVNVNLPRDTYEINVGAPDVDINLDPLTSAIDRGVSVDSINGLTLDSIKTLIRELGVDSVRQMLVDGAAMDSVRNDYLGGIDSALTDTSGGDYDTSGFMSEIRGWGDSLAAAVWGYPCDTTGGRSCDNAYIGSNGLATAQQDLKNAYAAGADSIKNGAFGDSLRHWSNLITNNGVLSGAGSASCPSVFTRTWNVPLGPTGMSYTFGPYSRIVCYNFFAGITFWSLARVILRILVAIGCMMWLYHAVTGTSGGNDDED